MEVLKESLKTYRILTIVLSIIALAMSYYTVYIAQEKLKNPNYKAICDISETWSCSPVFVSSFGQGFGIVHKIVGKRSLLSQFNGVYGCGLYTLFILFAFFHNRFVAKIEVIASICGGVASTYGFIHAFWFSPYICVVCLCVHSITYTLLIISILKLRIINQLNQTISMKKRK